MICSGEIGPGQNIVFFLVTTGLDINPANGTVGEQNYEYLKTVLSEGADILYELPALRYITDVDYSSFINAYDSKPRTLYQALFGVARYSNPWSATSLTTAIESSTLFPKFWPANNTFSLNPYEMYDKGFGLYQCIEITPGILSWQPMTDFKITEKMPGIADGKNKSVWGVLNAGKLDIYVKNVFLWTPIDEYVADQNSTLTVSKTAPSLSLNNFWLKIDDLNFYEFNDTEWSSATPVFVRQTLAGSFNDGDYILAFSQSSFILYHYLSSKYTKTPISQYIIRDKDLNTTFQSSVTENFIIEDDCIALLGGIVSHLFDGDKSMVKVYHDGVYVGEYVGLDFKNVDISESVALANTVEVIHTIPSNNNLTLTNISIPVTSNNQTVFSVPSNMVELIEIDVNGVASTAFTFDNNAHTLTFNPTLAGYQLDQYDELIVTYFY